MKRRLITQMLREWKANIWLILELVIVVLILQYLLGTLYALYRQHSYAGGQKLEDVYFADFGILQKDSEGYVEWDSIHTWQSDLDLLMTQLRGNQYVEVAAVGGFNSLPYNYNFMGNRYYYKTPDGKKSHEFTVNVREMSPEMMEVLQMHGLKGETPKQLADMLRKGEVVLGETEEPEDPDEPTALDAVGREAYNVSDSLSYRRVGAAAPGMRRNDYETLWHKTLYASIDPEQASMIAVRVKPGTGNRFLESLTDKDRQAGNVYLSNMESVSNMRDRVHLDINQAIRNFVICSLFIMLVIFLGFLGTFWFRTQQRVSEIAIRKVNGATNGDIYARFFSEGLIMLAMAAVISVPLAFWLFREESLRATLSLIELDNTMLAGGAIATILVLGITIVCSIYAPARRATRIDPAAALKDM